MDWTKYVKVYDIEVKDIHVKKEVNRADVIQAMLNENEVAFKGKKGQFMLLQVKKDSIDIVKKLLIQEIDDVVNLIETNEKRVGSTSGELKGDKNE